MTIREKVQNKKYFRRMMKSRGKRDLIKFYNHFEEQGIKEEVIQLVINETRRILHCHNFIPKVADSFEKDYKWDYIIMDQYSTPQMMLAGYVLTELDLISITDRDWNKFHEENGTIDNYDTLFRYLNTKYDIKS